MSYRIEIKRSAVKEIQKLPKGIQNNIGRTILELKDNPFTGKTVKLKTNETLYRLRVGNYRIVYTIEKQIQIISIIKVGHRKDIYKKI